MIEIMEPSFNVFRDVVDYLMECLKDRGFEPRKVETPEKKVPDDHICEEKCFCDNGTTKACDGEIMSMDEFTSTVTASTSARAPFGSALMRFADNRDVRNHRWGC